MPSALIGSTGFVGRNLAAQAHFDDGYHSRNVQEMAGREYDLVVCAAAPAEKWRANLDPERDRAAVESLMEALRTIRVSRLLLISTVDVYPQPVEVDEDTPISADANHPYGRHRLLLEDFARSCFRSTVVRLPGVFGPGLKKNVIFDLLHGRPVTLPGQSRHQYYDLQRLWTDLQRALELEIPLVNLATEPVELRAIARVAFGLEYPPRSEDATVARYDMRTRHAVNFGGSGYYLEDAVTVLDRIRAFVDGTGWRRP